MQADQPTDPQAQPTRAPPHSVETEESVLATWLADPAFAGAWRPDPSIFYVPKNRHIAEAAAKLDPATRDEAALLEQLRRDGAAMAVGDRAGLSKITLCAMPVSDPQAHVVRLRELAGLRALVAACNAATLAAHTGRDLGSALGIIQDGIRDCQKSNGVRMQSIRELFATMVRRALARQGQEFCRSGVDRLDQDLGGLVKRFVTVVGADTNVGKSSFITMVADENKRDGKRVMLVSFEDDEELWARRIMQRRADVSASKLRSMSGFTDQELVDIQAAADAAERDPFFLNANNLSVDTIANEITARCATDGFDLVIVDYLQAIETDKYQSDRRNQLTYIARRLTNAIKGAGAAGVLVSQVTRPEKGSKEYKPGKHDLKESGDIENAAENVLMLYECASGERHLYTAKAKDGGPRQNYALKYDTRRGYYEGQANGACKCGKGGP